MNNNPDFLRAAKNSAIKTTIHPRLIHYTENIWQGPQKALGKAAFVIVYFLLSLAQTSKAQTISMVAGTLKSACPSAPCGDGDSALNANLYSPAGITIDANDNIYIAEYSNHCIRKVDKATGFITTYAGIQRTSCSSAPCGDGGAATSANLSGPRGMAVDSEGHLYIADFSNHVIRKVDKNTGIITTVAGTMKSSCAAAPCGDGNAATSARLSSPTHVAFDASGNMYIADYGNHVIRRVDKNTNIITTYAGTMKSACSAAPCGDGNAATSGLFNGPSGIVFDANDNLYIAEYGNHSVRRVDKATGIITTYAGNLRASCSVSPCGDGGPATHTDARLTSPFSVGIDKNDHVYIADASNSAIRHVDKNTGIITTVAGIPRSSCSAVPCGNDGPATSAQLSNPFGLVFGSDNTMYIADYGNQAVRKVTGGAFTLPVTLTDLRVKQRGQAVDLTWKAVGETNVSRYDIEKSSNGNAFRINGTIAAKGNGDRDIFYSYTDNHPATGSNYYRVKSVDKDGATKFSSVVIITMGNRAGLLQISPNPVINKTLYVQWSNIPAGRYELMLFNSQGQKVFDETIQSNGGSAGRSISLPAFITHGVYSVQVRNGLVVKREKIVIQ